MYGQFQERNTEVLVIGGGNLRDAVRLSKMFKFPFPLLADPDRSVYHHYGLDKVLFAVQRSGSFLIDDQGIVRYIHRATNPQASASEAELMQEVEKLQTPPEPSA
jgi:peroxiredoxin